MIRIDNVDDITFDVEEHPVFFERNIRGGTKRILIPGKKALVNARSARALGIVGRSYQLVTNRQALGMAYQCCRTIFPETTDSEWKINRMEAPQSLSFCHVEMAHNSTALDFSLLAPGQRPDAYGPFIRVVNSFNGMHALAFHIGFFRKVCSNGLILPNSVISFRYSHVRGEMDEVIRFETTPLQVAELRSSLSRSTDYLGSVTVPHDRFKPLVMKGLRLKRPQLAAKDKHVEKAWGDFNSEVSQKCAQYASDLGENAYAVLNVITDIASNPPLANRCIFRTRHSLQQLAGVWMQDFTDVSHEIGFDLDAYIRKPA